MNGWTVLIAAHAVAATLALVLGGYVVLRRTKGDVLHKRVGRVWVVTMYWVSFSSFGIQRLDPGHFSFIHLLSIWTIISLTIALWAVRTGRIDVHRGFMIGTYCGLVGAGIAASAFPQRLIPQTAMHEPGALAGALVAVVVLAVGIIGALRPQRTTTDLNTSPLPMASKAAST